MSTWLDPNFDQVLRADLLVVGDVVSSAPDVTYVRVDRAFAGAMQGETVAIYRAPIIGHGHAGDTIEPGRYLFVAMRRPDGQFAAITDSYWRHPFSDPDRIHLGIRDPFTRSHVPVETIADVLLALGNRDVAQRLIANEIASIESTRVGTDEPFDVHTQIIGLEVVALLGPNPGEARQCARFLASPHYQVRWSAARASAQLTDVLVAHLMREDAPPVQSAIVDALRGRISVAHQPALAKRLPALYAEDILLSKNIMNPAMNSLRSPRAALAELL